MTTEREWPPGMALPPVIAFSITMPKPKDSLTQAQELAERHNLKEELTLIHYLRGNLHFPQGRIEECLAEHQRALDLAREIGSPEAEARALGGLADAEYARGRMLSSHARFKACVELAREHGLGRIEVANLNMKAYTHLFSGDVRESLKLANAAVAAAMKVGHQRAEVIARESAFECNFNLCNFADAREQVTKSLALSQRLGAKRFESEDLIFLAAMDFRDGRKAEAMQGAEAALALGRETGMKYIGPVDPGRPGPDHAGCQAPPRSAGGGGGDSSHGSAEA